MKQQSKPEEEPSGIENETGQAGAGARCGLKCPKCELIVRDRYCLKRHIKRKHGEEHVNLAEKGNCMCLECGYKCHRIENLRTHLVDSHEFMFRFEDIEFGSIAGNCFLL